MVLNGTIYLYPIPKETTITIVGRHHSITHTHKSIIIQMHAECILEYHFSAIIKPHISVLQTLSHNTPKTVQLSHNCKYIGSNRFVLSVQCVFVCVCALGNSIRTNKYTIFLHNPKSNIYESTWHGETNPSPGRHRHIAQNDRAKSTCALLLRCIELHSSNRQIIIIIKWKFAVVVVVVACGVHFFGCFFFFASGE